MNQATRTNIGRNMAVLYIDHSTEMRTVIKDGQQVQERIPTTSRSIISLATVQSALSNRFRITGLDSPTEASELALLLLGGYAFALEPLVQRAVRGSGLEGVLRLEPMLACLIAGALVCNRWEQRRAFAALLRRTMPPVPRRLFNPMHPMLHPGCTQAAPRLQPVF